MFMVNTLLIFFIFYFIFCRAGDTSRRPPPPLPAQQSGRFRAAAPGPGGGTGNGDGDDDHRAGAEGAAPLQAAPWPQPPWGWAPFAPRSLVVATEAGEQRAGSGRSAAPGRAGGSRPGSSPAASARRSAPSPPQAVKWRLLPTSRRKRPSAASPPRFSPPRRDSAARLPITPLSLCGGCGAAAEVAHGWAAAPRPGRGQRGGQGGPGPPPTPRPHLAGGPSTGRGVPAPRQGGASETHSRPWVGQPGSSEPNRARSAADTQLAGEAAPHKCPFAPLSSSGTLQRSQA